MVKPQNEPNAPSVDGAALSAEDQQTLQRFSSVVGVVRLLLRDFAKLNRLIDQREHSDHAIALQVLLTIDAYNATPPLLPPVKIDSFPSIELLARGTMAALMLSSSKLQIRNRFVYSDGQGLRASATDTANEYAQMGGAAWEQWKQDVRELKIALNYQSSLNGSGVNSEYRLLAAFLGDEYDE
jgi:hypothetical protein